MKKFTLLFFLLVIITICNAQSKFGWAKSYVGDGTLAPLASAVDATGNVYTAGIFSDEANFDPVSGSSTIISKGESDIFITKRDAVGDLLWVKTIGDVNSDELAGMSLDASGNIYMAGYFDGTVDFDPGPASHPITSTNITNSNNVFIVKLDADGEYMWAKSFAGQNSECRSIAVDADGNVFTTGYFGGVVDFDPGAGVQNRGAINTTNVFISKLNTDGEYVWAKEIDAAEGLAIAVDASGNVYTSGYFSGSTTFDPGTGTVLNSGTTADAFFLKLDAAGDFVWAKQIGGSSYNPMPNGMAVDASGALYVIGWFEGDVNFDPDINRTPLTSAGAQDVFILKLDAAGTYVWATQIGDDDDDYGGGIKVDAAGNVYATGFFRGDVDVDPGAPAQMLSSAGGADIYLVKLTTGGDYAWSTSFGSGSDDIGTAMAVTGLDNIYLSGIFQGTIDLDPGSGTADFTAPVNASSAFIVQLPPILPLALTLLNFEAVDNNTTVQLHWQTTKEENMAGFTIERSANGKQFEAIGSVAVNNSFNLVNNYTFTDAHPLSTTSYYRLKINELNGPVTYSRTIPVKRQGKAQSLQVSPNPASNVLYVQIDAQEAITLQITDVTGHVVYQQSKTIKGNTAFPVSLQGLPAGNYYLIMKGKTTQKTQQFLKR